MSEAASRFDVTRYRVEMPPPRYAPSTLPGIEDIQDARAALARRRYEDAGISEDEFTRAVDELREREAALRRQRADALADLDDELAALHEWFVETATDPDLRGFATGDSIDRRRAQAVHLLRLRRQLLELSDEDERRKLYERERRNTVENLPPQDGRRSLVQLTDDIARTGRFHDAAVRYVTVVIDEQRSDPELLDAARRALEEVRRWDRDQDELRQVFDELAELRTPDEFVVVGPMIDRIQSVGMAYVELQRPRVVEAVRSELRSAASDRGFRLKTQATEIKRRPHLLAAVQGRDADLRKLAASLWRLP